MRRERDLRAEAEDTRRHMQSEEHNEVKEKKEKKQQQRGALVE